MPVYLILAFAVLFETVGTTALKASEQFTRLGPSILVVLAYAASFYLLSITLRTMSVGIVYALWSGLGIVMISAIGWTVFGQKLDFAAIAGLAMIVGGIAVIGLMVFIVPKFSSTFDEMGATLPKPTLALMAMSTFLTRYGLILVALLTAGFIALKKWVKHGQGQQIWHKAQLKIPIMGAVIRTNAYAHFSRTFGTLLQNGVSILPALGIVQKTIDNVIISEEIGKAQI